MTKDKNIVDELLFFGGLDRTSDEKYVKNGDYVSMRNGVKMGDDNYGVIKPLKGTELINSTYTSPSIAGSTYDYKRGGLILLINDDDGVTKDIVRYDEDGNKTDILMKNPHLNFDTKASVKLQGDFLIWQERGQPAQIINVVDAENENVTYDIEAKLSLIKRPPLYDIDFVYGYDPSFNGSNIFTRMFQFSEQYICKDDFPSAFSPVSKIGYSEDIFVYEGGSVQTGSSDNFIDIQFNSGDETVEKIKIATREGNTKDWYEVVTIDKSNPENVIFSNEAGDGSALFATDESHSAVIAGDLEDNTTYYYRFYNTGGYNVIPDREIAKPYEFLPVKSDAATVIESNRIVFGQNQMDYQGVNASGLVFTPKYNSLPSGNTKSIPIEEIKASSEDQDEDGGNEVIHSEIHYDLSNLPNVLYSGSVIKLRAYQTINFKFMFTEESTWDNDDDEDNYTEHPPFDMSELEITLNKTVSLKFFGTHFNEFITPSNIMYYKEFNYSEDSKLLNLIYEEDTGHYDVRNVDDESESEILDGVLTDTDTNAIVKATILKKTLKRGRWYQGVIQYLDRYGRAGEPQQSDSCDFFVDDTLNTASDKNGKVDVEVSGLDNISIPDWGYYYRFLISYIPQSYVQTPILYASVYRDLDGTEDGSAALMVGMSVDVYSNTLNDEIESLEKEADSLEKIHHNIELSVREKQARGGENINEQITHLQRKIELKKQELGNSRKFSLSNLRQYQIGIDDRIRIIHDDITSDTNNLSQIIDLPVLDVLNANYEPDEDEDG